MSAVTNQGLDPMYSEGVNPISRPNKLHPFGTFNKSKEFAEFYKKSQQDILNYVDQLNEKDKSDILKYEPDNREAMLFDFEHIKTGIKSDSNSFNDLITSRIVENGLMNYDNIRETPIISQDVDENLARERRLVRSSKMLNIVSGEDNDSYSSVDAFLGETARDKYNDDFSNPMRETNAEPDTNPDRVLKMAKDQHYGVNQRMRGWVMNNIIPESAEGVINPGKFEVHGMVAEADVKNKGMLLNEELKKRNIVRGFNPDQVNTDEHFGAKGQTTYVTPRQIQTANALSKSSFFGSAFNKVKEGFSEMFSNHNNKRSLRRIVTEKETLEFVRNNPELMKKLKSIGMDTNEQDFLKMIKISAEFEATNVRESTKGGKTADNELKRKLTVMVNTGSLTDERWVKLDEKEEKWVVEKMDTKNQKVVDYNVTKQVVSDALNTIRSELQVSDATVSLDRLRAAPIAADNKNIKQYSEKQMKPSEDITTRKQNARADVDHRDKKMTELRMRKIVADYITFTQSKEFASLPKEQRDLKTYIVHNNLLPKTLVDQVMPTVQDIQNDITRLNATEAKSKLATLSNIQQREHSSLEANTTDTTQTVTEARQKPVDVNRQHFSQMVNVVVRDTPVEDRTKTLKIDRATKPTTEKLSVKHKQSMVDFEDEGGTL